MLEVRLKVNFRFICWFEQDTFFGPRDLDAFTVELTLFNPLETEVALSDLTVEVEDVHNPAGPSNESASQLADIEVLERVTLLPRQSRTVCTSSVQQFRSGDYTILIIRSFTSAYRYTSPSFLKNPPHSNLHSRNIHSSPSSPHANHLPYVVNV